MSNHAAPASSSTHRRVSSLLASAALAAVAGLCATSAARAQVPVIDGTRDAAYGTPFSVQTVQTGFGDNQSELDAGYMKIQNGKLYLFGSGNLEANFNKFVIFFDTRAGGQNVMRSDNPDVDFNALNSKYAGMKFDTNFSPDYALWWSGDNNNMFLNFSELNTNGGGLGGFLGQVATPNPNRQGSGTVGGAGGLPKVDFGYNDSNVAGVAGGSGAADQTAAAAVSTGNEVAIDLSQIGALENFKIMIGINGSNHDFWSNQFLKGLVPPQGNLGSDGMGNFIPPGSVSLVDFSTIAGDQFETITYHAPLSQWAHVGDGNWNAGANWTGDGVPNAPDARAVLGIGGGTGPHTVTLDTNVSLQSLTFDSTGTYTIAASGGNALTIAGNPASPAVLVNSGNHTIAAPLILGATTNFTVATGTSLRVTGPLTATGQTVVKAGGGSVQFPNLRAAGLFVGEGTVSIATNGTDTGASDLGNLSFAGGTTPTAAFDVNDNDVVLRSGAAADVATLIRSGRNNGAWTGQGITSSAARTQTSHATTIGLLTGAEYHSVGGTTFDGLTVNDTDLLTKYTWYGDTDFNGRVNFDDYVRTDNGFNNHLTGWLNGDFDLNGSVNFDDYVLIDLAFNTQSGTLGRALSYLDGSDRSTNGMNGAALQRVVRDFAEFGNDYAGHLLAAVPEPTLAGIAGVATSVAMLRRRRHARSAG
jgi:hypothetical protein